MRLIALALSLVVVSCAQDKKRLESVTWDVTTHKLVWSVQTGSVGASGKFDVKATERYEIAPDEAVMKLQDEKRGFTPEEAAALHRILDVLSVYCAESVEWWDRGEGVKLDKKPGHETSDPATPRHLEPKKPVPGTRTTANPVTGRNRVLVAAR